MSLFGSKEAVNTARPNRRAILAGIGGTVFAAAMPSMSLAAIPTHRLRMVTLHNGERFDEEMVRNGALLRSGLDKFRAFARDWRQNQELDIRPEVVQTAIQLQRMVGNDEPMVLISGYRSPKTNGDLKGTATNSLHMQGYALDLRQPGVSTSTLHRAAVSLKGGGVGMYTKDAFVHVDCGRVRYWGS